MAANITNNIGSWSVTSANNQPDAGDAADIQADLQAIQSAVKKIRAISADIASGSTVDLATATGDFVTVTGTTTITALGTVAAGLRYIVRFAASLTVTHDATSLILPSGGNVTVQANDIMIMESLGSGNWRCLAYLPVTKSRAWTDVSSSRAINVEYTNTNAYEIFVATSFLFAGTADGSSLLFKVGGVVVEQGYNVTTNSMINFGAIPVPPGAVYEVEAANAALWTEYIWTEYS